MPSDPARSSRVWTKLVVCVPNDLLERWSAYCYDHGLNMSAAVRELIVQTLGPAPDRAHQAASDIEALVTMLNRTTHASRRDLTRMD